MIQAQFDRSFEGWRREARRLLVLRQEPHTVFWGESALFGFQFEVAGGGASVALSAAPPPKLTVPPSFLTLAESVSYARSDDRWDLLYRILYRLQIENPELLNITVDSDVHRAMTLAKSVSRDIHKMHAFVRFKKTLVEDQEHYVAWHKPEHLIVKPGTPFFARRFGDRPWTIFTPDESAHWNLKELSFGPGLAQSEFHARDDWDEVWKTYYKSIFNPARIKIKAMKTEMSPKYWSSMPETALIHELVREAPQRLQKMAKNQNQAAVVPQNLSLAELKEKATTCTACPLYQQATHTVFGAGPSDAQIMIVGEQPGDQEDLAGLPFVGPAGQMLNEIFLEAGIDRNKIYLTNAVKHFKWVRQGKMRLHQKPTGTEMHACKPWLENEIQKVQPKIILALGATAATMILGRRPKVSEERGRVMENVRAAPSHSSSVVVTWHPSAILRATDQSAADQMRAQLRADLKKCQVLFPDALCPETGPSSRSPNLHQALPSQTPKFDFF